MLKQKFQAVLAVAFAALGIKELPKGEDGKLALDADQELKLKSTFTGKNYDAFLKVANDILAEEAGIQAAEDAEKENANNLLASVLQGNAGDDDDGEDSGAPGENNLEANAKKAALKIASQQAQIVALSNEPVADSAVKNIIKKTLAGTALAASLSTATHLYGANADVAATNLFKFEGRNWNARAAGHSVAKTDFEDVSTITRLNEDLKEYQVKNPNFLRDLYDTAYDLPGFWPVHRGVIDRVTDAVMSVGNVTQARKPDWTPGFQMWVEAESRKIYRIQIDKQWNGYQLQELETTWLNTIYNFDGSSPYKHSFIAFLITKIYEKARQEDAEGAWNGIYAPNVHGITKQGHYLNAQSGLRHQLYFFRDVLKKITPYVSKVGRFSASNAQDYCKGFVESLPLEVRHKQNMVWYMSPSNLVKVQEDYKQKNALHNDYTGEKLNYIEGYPNITFQTDKRLEGSNLMFITDKENIEILEYLEEEKRKFRIEELKRDTYMHADYRFGCAFVFSGMELPENSEFKGVAQYIFVNDEPIFPATVTVPLFGKPLSAPVEINYNRLHVHPEMVADVTKLTGLPEGTVIEITGNAQMVTTAKIKKKSAGNGGNLDLTADFDPKTTYKLILVIQPDGTYKEITRVEEFPTGVPAVATFDDLVVDYTEGAVQKYEGEAGELTEIVGGNEGSVITLYGSENALTVKAVAGKIQTTGGDVVLNADAKFITLRNFGGVWYEIKKG